MRQRFWLTRKYKKIVFEINALNELHHLARDLRHENTRKGNFRINFTILETT